jgi:hypothetical protein
MLKPAFKVIAAMLLLIALVSCASKEKPKTAALRDLLYTASDGQMMKTIVEQQLSGQTDYFQTIEKQIDVNLEGNSITKQQADILRLQLEIKRLKQEVALLKSMTKAAMRGSSLALSLGQVAIDHDETQLKKAIQQADAAEQQIQFMHYENLYQEMGR